MTITMRIAIESLFCFVIFVTSAVCISHTNDTCDQSEWFLKCKITLDYNETSIAHENFSCVKFVEGRLFIAPHNCTNIMRFMAKLETCASTSEKFLRSHKWKLEEGEYEMYENYSLAYRPKYIEHQNFWCKWNEDFGKFSLGQYSWNRKVGSVYIVAPDCVSPPFQDADTTFFATSSISASSLVISIVLELTVSTSAYDRRPLVCYMSSLLLLYTFLIVRCIKIDSMLRGLSCYAITYAFFYFYRTAICWLNVIMFDMWRHLHEDRIFFANPKGSNKKFFFQSTYAWLLPVVDMAVFHMWAYIPDDESCVTLVGNDSIQTLMMGIVANVATGVNVVLCAKIVYNVRQYSKRITAVTKTKHQKLWRLFLKLTIINTIPYLIVIHNCIFRYFVVDESYLFDWVITTLPSLQGFFLLLVYYFNRRVWIKLYNKIK